MPYATNADLPPAIKSLPGAAQSIWRGAFTGFTKANPNAKEEAGFKVGWAAVKNKYHKNESGNWVANDASPGDDDYDGGEMGEDPCPSCGMDIPVGVKVCPNCAQPIEDAALNDGVSHLNLRDTIVMDRVRKDPDTGYLRCFPRVSRVGIQIYKGKELGRPDLGDVRVYRPPQEVFHRDAIKSMTHLPLTLTHPPEMVNAQNWDHYSVGHTGEDVLRDGESIRVPMMVMDAKAIDAYENRGVKELSVGYSTDLKWKKGTTRDGDAYDAIQTAIKCNHIAMVPAARGGETLNMGDTDPREIDPEALRHVRVITHHKTSPVEKKNAAADLKAYLVANYGDEDGTEKYDRYVEGLDVGDGNPFSTPLYDKDFTSEEREKLAKSGAAMPGGGFPIRNKEDLSNAIHAIGRAKNPAAAKAHIIKRARALGAEKSLPADWVKSTTTDRKGDTTMSAIVVIDGARLEVADTLTANVIEKHVSGLHNMAADLKGKLDKAAADKEEADEETERQQKDAKAKIDAKDGEIAALKKQLADSQAKTTPEILDQLVKDRAAVIDRASKVLDKAFVFDGKKPEDIRRAAVVRGLGDAACKDMSDAAIEGAFLALTSGKGNGVGQLADALSRPGHRGNGTDTRDAAFGEHINYLHNAWKGPQKQAS